MSKCWKIRVKLEENEPVEKIVKLLKEMSDDKSELSSLIVQENVNDKMVYYPHIQGLLVTTQSERKIRSQLKELFSQSGNKKYSLANNHNDWVYYSAYLVKNVKHCRHPTVILYSGGRTDEDISMLLKKYNEKPRKTMSNEMTKEEALFSELKAYLDTLPPYKSKLSLAKSIIIYFRNTGKIIHKVTIARLLETYVAYQCSDDDAPDELCESILDETCFREEAHDARAKRDKLKNCQWCQLGGRSSCHKHSFVDPDEYEASEPPL